jgi:hypothetical protein
MKKKLFSISLVLLALMAFQTEAMAQTYHEDIRGEIHAPVFCLNEIVTGYWVYHMTYHVDKKTGEITRVHWNVKDAHLEDGEGNVYKLVDTGSDNYGGPLESLGGISYAELWDNIMGFNQAVLPYYEELYGEDFWVDYYDSNGDILEDGWMDGDLPVEPYEGVFVNQFKLLGKHGQKVSIKEVTKYHIDQDGNLVLDFRKITDKCNW